MTVCRTFPLTDGTAVIVCGSRRSLKTVCACGQPGTKLCDFFLEKSWQGKKLCSKPLCDTCAVSVGTNLDHCPDHPKVAGEQLKLGDV